MSTNTPGQLDREAGRSLRQALLSASILLVGAALTMWWVKETAPRAAPYVAIGLAVLVMAGSVFIARRHERHMDEVQIALQGYAMTKGYIYGAMITIFLLSLPPVANWLVDLVDLKVAVGPDAGHRREVKTAFVFGACMVVVMQVIAAGFAAAARWRRMQ